MENAYGFFLWISSVAQDQAVESAEMTKEQKAKRKMMEAVAKHLRFKVPTKNAVIKGQKVEYFQGDECVFVIWIVARTSIILLYEISELNWDGPSQYLHASLLKHTAPSQVTCVI